MTQLSALAKGSSFPRPRASFPGLHPTRNDLSITLPCFPRAFDSELQSKRLQKSCHHPAARIMGGLRHSSQCTSRLGLVQDQERRLLCESCESRGEFPVDTVCYT